MKYYYFLIAHDYRFKESSILKNCTKYNGLHLIEKYCERFVLSKEGDKPIKYYLSTDRNREYGYFIEKSMDDLNKLTVKHKYVKSKGYFMDEVVIENIISFKVSHVLHDNEYDFGSYYHGLEFIHKELYDKVIESIKLKIPKYESE